MAWKRKSYRRSRQCCQYNMVRASCIPDESSAVWSQHHVCTSPSSRWGSFASHHQTRNEQDSWYSCIFEPRTDSCCSSWPAAVRTSQTDIVAVAWIWRRWSCYYVRRTTYWDGCAKVDRNNTSRQWVDQYLSWNRCRIIRNCRIVFVASSITRTRQVTACSLYKLMKAAYNHYFNDNVVNILHFENWCAKRRIESPQSCFWDLVMSDYAYISTFL